MGRASCKDGMLLRLLQPVLHKGSRRERRGDDQCLMRATAVGTRPLRFRRPGQSCCLVMLPARDAQCVAQQTWGTAKPPRTLYWPLLRSRDGEMTSSGEASFLSQPWADWSGEAGLARGEDFLHVFSLRRLSRGPGRATPATVDATDGGWRTEEEVSKVLSSTGDG
ncbi:hypothetical protein M440DRAFT_1098917 [Trichoderma longibrachiatum ATCC 18648]|uniref:Uncharacterized protein n=1 Tax=Trichoderma longibrachiatum ATCC 18648 TaxID=983965 RepID=A0A2T4BS03_TRILO|nr:hypothetical protein M440DRAFT_1098917 [Trichoderma longibrachiatum ATCC 18648]